MAPHAATARPSSLAGWPDQSNYMEPSSRRSRSVASVGRIFSRLTHTLSTSKFPLLSVKGRHWMSLLWCWTRSLMIYLQVRFQWTSRGHTYKAFPLLIPCLGLLAGLMSSWEQSCLLISCVTASGMDHKDLLLPGRQVLNGTAQPISCCPSSIAVYHAITSTPTQILGDGRSSPRMSIV